MKKKEKENDEIRSEKRKINEYLSKNDVLEGPLVSLIQFLL
jgi:hypothetical protein